MATSEINETNLDETEAKRKTKNKKKKLGFAGYFYFFLFIFFATLAGLSYLIKSYSPDIDVSIGNNDSLTLNDSDMEIEIKSVDERLKWIQMEDELPSVALRENEKKQTEEMLKEQKQKVKTEEKKKTPAVSDEDTSKKDFKKAVSEIPVVVPNAKPSVTKVYLGNYASLEEAIEVQNKISQIEPSVTPFVKSVNDHYIVQLGSFADSERAGVLAEKLRAKGYYPRINYGN